MKLTELRSGDTGVIRTVAGEAALRLRLLEMGLLPGASVSVARRAPLGDPLELRMRGYSLTLRASDARMIVVDGKGN